MVLLPKRLHFEDGTERLEHVSAPFAADLSWRVNARGRNEAPEHAEPGFSPIDIHLTIGHRATFSWRSRLAAFHAWVASLNHQLDDLARKRPIAAYCADPRGGGALHPVLSVRVVPTLSDPDTLLVAFSVPIESVELSWLCSHDEFRVMLQRLEALDEALLQEIAA